MKQVENLHSLLHKYCYRFFQWVYQLWCLVLLFIVTWEHVVNMLPTGSEGLSGVSILECQRPFLCRTYKLISKIIKTSLSLGANAVFSKCFNIGRQLRKMRLRLKIRTSTIRFFLTCFLTVHFTTSPVACDTWGECSTLGVDWGVPELAGLTCTSPAAPQGGSPPVRAPHRAPTTAERPWTP